MQIHYQMTDRRVFSEPIVSACWLLAFWQRSMAIIFLGSVIQALRLMKLKLCSLTFGWPWGGAGWYNAQQKNSFIMESDLVSGSA